MEIEKEAFTGLMEYYKKLPIETKRKEIISELEEVIFSYSKICTKFGVMPNMMLNKEMLKLNKKNMSEDEYLDALFAYVNALQDMSSQFINKMCDEIDKRISIK